MLRLTLVSNSKGSHSSPNNLYFYSSGTLQEFRAYDRSKVTKITFITYDYIVKQITVRMIH